MVNKDKTLTVAHLLGMLRDGRITPDLPIAMFSERESAVVRGIDAFELYTCKDGSQVLVFFGGAVCADLKDVETTTEVFP